MKTDSIRVLLIEDDPMVQEINRQFVDQVDHFTVIGVAHNGVEGIRKIRELNPDLVLLDVYMPLQDGKETLVKIRKQFNVDVIAITAANDLQTIKNFLQQGAVDYLIKPFVFERLKKSLEHYFALKQNLESGRTVSQSELDELIYPKYSSVDRQHSRTEDTSLPKGLNELTLKRIHQYMLEQPNALSAEEVAEAVGISRVTARRYLEYLVSTKEALLDIQYGAVGRPINRYLINRG